MRPPSDRANRRQKETMWTKDTREVSQVEVTAFWTPSKAIKPQENVNDNAQAVAVHKVTPSHKPEPKLLTVFPACLLDKHDRRNKHNRLREELAFTVRAQARGSKDCSPGGRCCRNHTPSRPV